MRDELVASLKRLSDKNLLARLEELAAHERGETVLLVAHLAELDTRDAHLRAGHGSLFAYCRATLALSEQEAYNRIAGARAARRFPVVLEMLEAGALNLTSVRILAPRLTTDNHRAAFEAARGKTKLQVEELAARLWPRPDVRSFVRKLPEPSASPQLPAPPANSSAVGPIPPAVDAREPPSPSLPPTELLPPPSWVIPKRVAEVTPLSPGRYKIQITISAQTLEKLQRAKDLLRHAIPSGDEAAVLDRALTALLAALAQRKFAATEKPRAKAASTAGSRHIPAEVRREVWQRDRGCCAFVGTGGRRCLERAFLEFHHVRPFGVGGEASVRNIELRCRAHNACEARADFGPPRALSPGSTRMRESGST